APLPLAPSLRHLSDRSLILQMMIEIKRRNRCAWSTRHLCDKAKHEASFRTTRCGLIEMLVFSLLADSLDACDTRPSWFFRVFWLCGCWRAVSPLLRGGSPAPHTCE